MPLSCTHLSVHGGQNKRFVLGYVIKQLGELYFVIGT
jgi:hypothetical protein